MADLMTSQNSKNQNNKVEINFYLNQNQDPPPPYDIEILWAREVEADLYSIESIPLWTDGVSRLDEVYAEDTNGLLYFRNVIRSKGHSLIRAYVDTYEIAQQIDSDLEKSGCMVAGIERNGLYIVGIDVPFTIDLEEIIAYLNQQTKENGLEFEGASIRHKTSKGSQSHNADFIDPSLVRYIKPPES